ncbi:ChaC-like protein [Penicillium verhagenii]|uniref:ChaC-like protein n=1 Tax=Penicillium verhagenii TaxID=1562060 RepID=UPI002545912F|nr:ChaC-like protein [Penicillium verhagenii]KAJ5929972.1 ChaC-like protein [Penicillium verhagenii]
MAASLQGHQVHPEGRTWKTHFPKGDLWVFGYGSLIWKPPPHYANIAMQTNASQATSMVMFDVFGRTNPDTTVHTFVWLINLLWTDIAVLFAGLSTDHRGTPEQPGRVVTVIEREFWETLDDPLAQLESDSESTAKVWGAAYHIPASHAEEVHDYLDEREIDGYSAHFTPFHPVSGEDPSTSSICMVYIGQPTNPQFLRELAHREPQHVAQVISGGHGLSGKNTEYLFLLEKALEGIGLGSADVHVTDLVKRVKAIEAEGEGEREEREAAEEVEHSLAAHEEVQSGDSIE